MSCIHGHYFQPRYDVVSPKWMESTANLKEAMIDSGIPIEAAYERRYVCDVCQRCGKTAMRPVDGEIEG